MTAVYGLGVVLLFFALRKTWRQHVFVDFSKEWMARFGHLSLQEKEAILLATHGQRIEDTYKEMEGDSRSESMKTEVEVSLDFDIHMDSIEAYCSKILDYSKLDNGALDQAFELEMDFHWKIQKLSGDYSLANIRVGLEQIFREKERLAEVARKADRLYGRKKTG